MSAAITPSVWYLAAGYGLPAGIEAYLLHYATELRNQGFETRILVFEPLPHPPHRFLVALRERGIPIESLFERVTPSALALTGLTYLPWRMRRLRKAGNTPHPRPLPLHLRQGYGGQEGEREQRAIAAMDSTPSPFRGEGGGEGASPSSLLHYWLKRLAVRELERMIARAKPDIIHVKGRIICEALPVLPSDRTIYQHALMGTRDPSWTDEEAAAFSGFLNRIAAVLVQGRRIAETFAESFHINRPIEVVFTMAPDEARGLPLASSDRSPQDSEENTPHLNPLPQGERKEGIQGSRSYAPSPGERKDGIQGSGSYAPSPLRGEGWGEGGYLGDNSSKSAVASLRFGILCRFTEQKGIPYILEALRMYRARHGAVDFTFAGQGPLEGLIRETIDLRPWTLDRGVKAEKKESVAPTCDREDGMAARSAAPHQDRSNVYGLKSKVYAPGIRVVPVSSAVAVLDQMDVFVHPGLDDAMPVSMVEALMCGVPCIVSDVGAASELVRDGVVGKVIKPASAEAILEAMEWFAALPVGELAAFKKRARARYRECCRPEVVGSQVAGLYRDVIAAHNAETGGRQKGPCR